VSKRQTSKLAALLLRLQTATEPSGKKTELAEYLGKPPQRVSEWLSGKHEPGAEVTLLMQNGSLPKRPNKQKTMVVLLTPPWARRLITQSTL